eukprot:scaffold2321_cov117-Skeletonema_marinoi.AAC.8
MISYLSTLRSASPSGVARGTRVLGRALVLGFGLVMVYLCRGRRTWRRQKNEGASRHLVVKIYPTCSITVPKQQRQLRYWFPVLERLTSDTFDSVLLHENQGTGLALSTARSTI